MQSVEELYTYFGKNHFAFSQGISIESIEEGGIAMCGLTLASHQKNSMGVAQGGILFTLADFTFAVGANSLAQRTVTLSGSINYISPGSGCLTARAVPLHSGKRTCVYQVSITNEEGRLVAQASFNGFKT